MNSSERDPVVVQLTEADGVDPRSIQDALRKGRQQLTEVPELWRDATVTVPAVAEWVRELVAVSVKGVPDGGDPVVRRGPSMLLTGPVGTGKTYAAWGAVRALLCSGAVCRYRFVRATRMFLDLEPSSGLDVAEELYELRTVGLLVIDDLGANKGSGRREEILTELLSERGENHRPTVVTTNVGVRRGESLADAVGERVASRLAEMCRGHVVSLTGPDLRRGA